MELLFNDGDEYIRGHGAPDLRLHCVLAGAQKTLDAQVLLDPFEEQFHLPTTFVQSGDRQWRQGHVVGQENQRLARPRILETNAPQLLGIILGNVKAIERDTLIANHAGGSLGRSRVHPPGIHTTLGARDKERASLMEFVQPRKVQVAAIHDVKSAGFDQQNIEHVDITHLAVADMNESRNRPAQIQQRMHFYRCLRRAKWCPVEQAQAQIDGRGIQRVNGRIESGVYRFFGIEVPRPCNQSHGQLVINAPVSLIQRIRQGRAGRHAFQSHVKQLGLIGSKTNLDIAQGFAPGQLREGHHTKHIGATQGTHSRIAAVAFDDASKGLPWHVFHDLRKQRLAHVHAPPQVV